MVLIKNPLEKIEKPLLRAGEGVEGIHSLSSLYARGLTLAAQQAICKNMNHLLHKAFISTCL